MVSIIICTYNMTETLERCILSCSKQQYSDIEILIIDDGSTDNTSEIISELVKTDSRIRYIYQEHQGHHTAMNNGIAQSKGEYIYFLDADDYIYAYCISTLMDNLKKADADISIGEALWSNNKPNNLSNNSQIYSAHDALSLLTSYRWNPIKQTFMVSWNKVTKKKLFDGVVFPVGLARDGMFSAHKLLTNAKQIVYTPLQTYLYSYRVTSEFRERIFREPDIILAYEDRLLFFADNGMTEFIPNTCASYLDACIQTFGKRRDITILEHAIDIYETYQEFIQEHTMSKAHYKRIQNILYK